MWSSARTTRLREAANAVTGVAAQRQAARCRAACRPAYLLDERPPAPANSSSAATRGRSSAASIVLVQQPDDYNRRADATSAPASSTQIYASPGSISRAAPTYIGRSTNRRYRPATISPCRRPTPHRINRCSTPPNAPNVPDLTLDSAGAAAPGSLPTPSSAARAVCRARTSSPCRPIWSSTTGTYGGCPLCQNLPQRDPHRFQQPPPASRLRRSFSPRPAP